jgi:hypothetical protein
MGIINGKIKLRLRPCLARVPLARHQWHPVPGWIGDPQPRLGKFERWQKRSHAAQRLYWRTHPELYRKMVEKMERFEKWRANRKASNA